MNTVLRFETWDGMPSWCVECSPEEWVRLTQPARDRKCPIDGSTVNASMLDMLMSRPAVKLPLDVPVDFCLELV